MDIVSDDLPDLPEGLTIPDNLAAITEDIGALLPSQSGTIQIIASPGLIDGAPYTVELRPADDVAIALPRSKAEAYAAAVWETSIRSFYLAGVRRQMRDVLSKRGQEPGKPDAEETAAWMTSQIADEMPDVDQSMCAPLEFQVGYSRRDGSGLVEVMLKGERLAIWPCAYARGHAVAVLDVMRSADLDSTYARHIARTFDDHGMARALVSDLSKYLGDIAHDQEFEVPARTPGQPTRAFSTPRAGARPPERRRRKR